VVNRPEASIVATDKLVELQVPPEVVSLSVTEPAPEHIEVGPLIGLTTGVGCTVTPTTATELQPEADRTVYETVVTPTDKPVTMPPAVIGAMVVSALLHVPGTVEVESYKVKVEPIQAVVVGPVMLPAEIAPSTVSLSVAAFTQP
jgi:hypothetical protein